MISLSLRKMVKYTLENEIDTRNDDNHLVALIDAMTNKKVLQVPYAEVMKNRFKYGLYSIESITRARRELQTDYPELRGTERVTRKRVLREEEVRNYYRDKKVE